MPSQQRIATSVGKSFDRYLSASATGLGVDTAFLFRASLSDLRTTSFITEERGKCFTAEGAAFSLATGINSVSLTQ